MKRSPVVVILGHVDSGKTTILDFIRKTEVRHKEAGGITQSIGAYEINHNNQNITFIDTPGHEAFSKMRSRGARVADVAVLVVTADRGVESQTKEAWQIIEEAKVPVIVAVNKIDKAEADINRTKADLAQNGILLEGYGGKISWLVMAAKQGQGIPELLDLILLTAEVENLSYAPEHPASGVVLESSLDSRRGPMATLIIKDGILKLGDKIATPSASGKVKSLENFLGERIKEATPSSPVLVLGFESLPKIGEGFIVGDKPPTTSEVVKIDVNIPTSDIKKLKLILKADTAGGLEALSGSLNKFSILNQGVGEITDGDIKEASAIGAVIVGYNVSVTKAAQNLAKTQQVKIIESAVIYEIVKLIEETAEASQEPVILGELEVLATFGRKGAGQIVGGRVTSGEIKNNINLEVRRRGAAVGQARVINLQQDKKDVAAVPADKECGLLLNSDTTVAIGDHLVSQ